MIYCNTSQSPAAQRRFPDSHAIDVAMSEPGQGMAQRKASKQQCRSEITAKPGILRCQSPWRCALGYGSGAQAAAAAQAQHGTASAVQQRQVRASGATTARPVLCSYMLSTRFSETDTSRVSSG